MFKHITPDDGSFTLHKLETVLTYREMFEHFRGRVFRGDGLSVNQRQSGIFTASPEKVGQAFCAEWLYKPKCYLYQPFDALLDKLCSEVERLTPNRRFTEAIVNVYGEGDFIAYHKDHHKAGTNAFSVVCSFESEPSESHLLEFYRTLNDPQTTRKDRSADGYTIQIPLPDRSAVLMDGMQRRWHGSSYSSCRQTYQRVM
jgi:hypothetical protein